MLAVAKSGSLSGAARELGTSHPTVFRVNSLIGACDAVHQNIGLAMLPVYVGKALEEIVPIDAGDCTIRSELWLVSTRAQQRKPLVRAFFEFMENEIGLIGDLMKSD